MYLYNNWDTKTTPKEAPGIFQRFLDWLRGVLPGLRDSFLRCFDAAVDWLVGVVHAANEPLKEHPYWALFISLFIFIGPWVLLIPLFLIQGVFFIILYILGFGLSGIIGGSPAALYQSFCYGDHTPSGSLFAMLQSTGETYNVGTANNVILSCIRLVAGALGIYVLLGIVLWW